MRLRKHGARLLCRVRLSRSGAGATITIPIEAIRALDWRYGDTLEMAMIERDVSPVLTRSLDRRRPQDYSHRKRIGTGDPVDVLRFIGIVMTRSQRAPLTPTQRRSYRYSRIRLCRLRVTSTSFMVTIPRDFVNELRWRESDCIRDHNGDLQPIMLAIVVMSDGIVVSRIAEGRELVRGRDADVDTGDTGSTR